MNSAVYTGIVNDEPIAQSDQFFNVLDIVNVDYGSLLALGPNGYIDAADIPSGLAGKGLAHWDLDHGYFI